MTERPPPIRDSPPSSRKAYTIYPDPDSRIGKAWASAWTLLRVSGTEYLDGIELSKAVAIEQGLEPITVKLMFARAAKRGLLDCEYRKVLLNPGTVTGNPRTRAFYRIAQ